MTKALFCCVIALSLVSLRLSAQDKALIDSLYRVFHAEKDAQKKADLLYDIAAEKRDAGNPDELFQYADSIELLARAARYPRGIARAFDVRGEGHFQKGEFAAALPFYHEELAIFTKIKDLDGQGRALSRIGGAWQSMQVGDSAIVYLLQALDIKERIGNKGDMAAAMANIANAYNDAEAHDKAIEMHLRVLKIRRELGEEKRSMFTLNNLAVAYGTKGDYEKSIAYADTGITIALKYNNKMVAGVICGGMGHVLNEQKRFRESIAWCERSLQYLTEAGRESNMVYPLCNMAAAYIGLGDYQKGLEVNQRGWAIMQKLKLNEPLDPYHENFANAYAGLGDYKNAYQWHKIYFTRIDSVTVQDNVSKLANIEAKYGLEKKERQLSEARAANYRQRVGLIALAAGLLAFLVFGWLFYNRYRLRQKALLDAAVIREQQLGLNAVIEAQEAERKRIAKDLHDGIAQELVALKLGFSALQHRLSQHNAAEAAQLENLARQLDESCAEVRTIAHVMLPPQLEQKGLAPSLEMLLRSSLQPAGIQAEFECHGLPERLEEKVEVGLYRIAQELINNVVKHAGAKQVRLQLYQAGANLVMRIEDNGKGYDFEAAKQKGSMGLLNILSRVRTLGGVFFSEPAVPQGAVATIRVPV